MDVRFIIDKWSISCWWQYLGLALLLSFSVRIVSGLLRGIELSSKPDNPRYWRCFWQSVRGYDQDPYKADYWFPYIIGVIEFLIYPFLIKAGLWLGIGLWITLKTVPQWEDWKKNRPVFNRFLIGNALVIILSFVLMANYVNISLK